MAVWPRRAAAVGQRAAEGAPGAPPRDEAQAAGLGVGIRQGLHGSHAHCRLDQGQGLARSGDPAL